MSDTCRGFLSLGLLLTLTLVAGAPSRASTFFPEEGTGITPEVLRIIESLEAGAQYVQVDDMRFPVEGLGRSGFSGTKWTNGIVYYTFDAAVTSANRTNWRNAAQEWANVANLTFIESSSATNRIRVINDSGNWSWVGMIGGVQDMGIYNWSWKFIIAHEIGHALGLSHEHSRSDRNTYVVINWANIIDDKEHNFDLDSTINYGAYDFDSVMHYDECAWKLPAISCPPNYTIECKAGYTQYQTSMGQRSYLSTLDKLGMAAHYGSSGLIFEYDFETGSYCMWCHSTMREAERDGWPPHD